MNEHIERFLDSSAYLDLPVCSTDELRICLKKLAVLDKEWMPEPFDKHQFYIRLANISMDPQLGVKSPSKAKIYAVVSPSRLRPHKMALKCATHS